MRIPFPDGAGAAWRSRRLTNIWLPTRDQRQELATAAPSRPMPGQLVASVATAARAQPIVHGRRAV
ncbi:hypothetical protein [Dactylosporangium sp. NPDC048998]|uniref:hypothetical protein n=1 Tax=Dactylosporangium sp. NPDC048998 TaxID=3363976 RepID=UPI003714F794